MAFGNNARSKMILWNTLSKLVELYILTLLFCHNFVRVFTNFIIRSEPPFCHNPSSHSIPNSDSGKRYSHPSRAHAHHRFIDPLTPLPASRRQPLNPYRKHPTLWRLLGYSRWTTPALILLPPCILHSRKFHRPPFSPFLPWKRNFQLRPSPNSKRFTSSSRHTYDSRSTVILQKQRFP